MNTCGTRTDPGLRRRGQAGFTLFAVLLAAAFMAGLVATYGRHVVVAGRGGMASPALLASREACQSGLAFARQAALAGQGASSSTIPIGDGEAMVTMVSKPGGHEVLSVTSVGSDGLGARRTAELAIRQIPDSAPASPGTLPTLSASKVQAVLFDGTLTRFQIEQSQRIEHAELTGLLVIYPGVELQLADVVLHGAVISSSVLQQPEYGAYSADLAPRLLVDGNLRIDPLGVLPGLAILMPDGAVSSGAADARIQIHGDVVADRVSLLQAGALSGHVLGEQVTLASASVLDRLGFDRKPPEWSSALALGGGNEPVFLAMIPASTSIGSLSPIIDYWHKD